MSRSERLNRLVIDSPCSTSWDAMEGSSARRFCAECQREVFDFAEMAPREIASRVQASHGRLCARLTKSEGRLVTARPAEPPPRPPTWIERRVATVAATLVTACLGAGRAGAQQPVAADAAVIAPEAIPDGAAEAGADRDAAATPRAGLNGRVADADGKPLGGVAVSARNTLDGSEQAVETRPDGSFTFGALPSGLYDVTGNRQGFEVTPQSAVAVQAGEQHSVEMPAAPEPEGVMLGGAIAVQVDPLRVQFDESELVVDAVFGRSEEVGREDDTVEVVTELEIATIFKGKPAGRTVSYHHTEYLTGDEGPAPDWHAEFTPGTHVLAFLEARDEDEVPRRSRPAFEDVSYGFGIRRLESAEREAYLDRLEALARLERRADRLGEQDPEAITGWLVATAEEPLTRSEAVSELESAFGALSERAARLGTSTEVAAQDLQLLVDSFRAEGGALSEKPSYEVLGAYLSDGQRARLTAALVKTETLREEDKALFWLVRRWDDAVARRWLGGRLRTVDPDAEAGENDAWWLSSLAEEMHDERLVALTEAANEALVEINELWPDDQSEATAALRDEKSMAVLRDLRRQFAAELASP